MLKRSVATAPTRRKTRTSQSHPLTKRLRSKGIDRMSAVMNAGPFQILLRRPPTCMFVFIGPLKVVNFASQSNFMVHIEASPFLAGRGRKLLGVNVTQGGARSEPDWTLALPWAIIRPSRQDFNLARCARRKRVQARHDGQTGFWRDSIRSWSLRRSWLRLLPRSPSKPSDACRDTP